MTKTAAAANGPATPAPKKNRTSALVLGSLALALFGGAAIAASGNQTLIRATDFVAPIGTLWINAIRMTVIPLVIALLITGVASMTEISAVGRIGIRAAAVFFALLTAMALVMGPLISATWHLLAHPLATRPPLPAGAAEAAGQLSAGDHPTGLASWVVSLLPTNPVAAAANGAMVPLILFTLLLAIAITRTPAASRERLVGFFSALQDAVLVLVRGVIALTPIGVFAMLLPIAAHGGAATVGAVGFYVLFYSVVLIVATLLLYPVVAAFGGLSIARFARAVLPAQLIAFSASSSLAALPALIEAAEDDLILDQKVTGFVLPVAASMFKIAAPVSWTTGALFVSWFYGVPLPLSGLLVVLAAAVFLAFMAPGIPRGAFIMLAPVFLAAGLPIEGVGILVAVDALPDVFSSVLNATGNLAATTLVARMETRVAPVILSDSRLQPASGAVVAAE